MIPPPPVRHLLYAYMDKIRNQVRSGVCPNIPHVTITGFDSTYEEMDKYCQELTVKLSTTPSFKLNLDRVGVMNHARLPRNVSLHVNPSEQSVNVKEIVLSQTLGVAKHFDRDELDSMSQHMVVIQRFHRASEGLAVTVANQYLEDFSFIVDRLYIVENTSEGLFIKREIPLIGYKREEIRDPLTKDSELLLAMLFAYRKSLSSKIRLHKLMWLLGEWYLLGHSYKFEPAPLGPYSYPLELATRSLVSEGLLTTKMKPVAGGGMIPEYTLTEDGKKVAGKCYMIFRDNYGLDIASLIKEFGDMPLKSLLDYVHGKWPFMRDRKRRGEDSG